MRLENKCCGDCSRCDLLKENKVDMIPCILDQLFQKQKRIEKSNEELKNLILSIDTSKAVSINLASEQDDNV